VGRLLVVRRGVVVGSPSAVPVVDVVVVVATVGAKIAPGPGPAAAAALAVLPLLPLLVRRR